MRLSRFGRVVIFLRLASCVTRERLTFGRVGKRALATIAVCLVLLLVGVGSALGQETTGGLQGTVKDQSGAVIPNAKVVATTGTLVGEKTIVTEIAATTGSRTC